MYALLQLPSHIAHTDSPSPADSDVSEVNDDDAYDESLLDRIYALKDIVPPTYRKRMSNVAETSYSWATSVASFSGKSLWVISTSALLLGVPWALAFSEEQQVQEMEREMRMQQSANEVSFSDRTIDGDFLETNVWKQLLTQPGGQTGANAAL